MPRFMAKRVTVNGVQQWVQVPIVNEEDMPLKVSPVTSVFDEPVTGPYKEYSYYGMWLEDKE